MLITASLTLSPVTLSKTRVFFIHKLFVNLSKNSGHIRSWWGCH